MPSKSFTADRVAAFRLARHHLIGDPERVALRDICRDVGGIQAQVMSAAELSLWTRRRKTRRDEVRAALWKTRDLVEATSVRRTLHLLPWRDFTKWSGLTTSVTTAVFDRLGPSLEAVAVDGERSFILRRDVAELAAATLDPSPILLPAFDTFLLAHSTKDHLVDKRFYKRVYRSQGWLSPVVIVSGRIVAVWFLEERAKSFTIDVQPFAALDAKIRRGIAQEAEALGSFLGARCDVQF